VGCILAVCIEGGEACEGAPTSLSFRRKDSVEAAVTIAVTTATIAVTTLVLLEGGEGVKGSDTAAWGVVRGVAVAVAVVASCLAIVASCLAAVADKAAVVASPLELPREENLGVIGGIVVYEYYQMIR
jgi:hypothetical protein